ncbi:MAG: YihY/virulence factor BrkB family protein [Acidobacteriota bacterium]|nr:YihY/virulence factor BrkB family protein [Acidobacteriota bacterium]
MTGAQPRHAGDRLRRREKIVARQSRVVVRLIGRAAWTAFVRFFHSDNLTYAASIAYYALLSLFPCLLLAANLLARVTENAQARARIFAFVLRYFPTQFHFVTAQISAFEAAGVTTSVAGTLALVWAALGVFGAVSTAINYAWGVPQRSLLKHRLVSFLMLLVAGGLLLLALAAISATAVVQASWFAALLDRFPGLQLLTGLTFRYSATLAFILVVGLIFYFVPNARVRFADIWLGAIVTGLLWRLALAGFSFYVRDMSRFSLMGSIAAVVVFLVWIYTSAVILLYGTLFTASYARLRRGRAESVPAAPSLAD